ncbi:MAG TPA: hypothetical protein PKA63_03915 [Oligoflexia bacterium]|nr:hypothetical protein [Oligoflexia bacterium]HMP47798.1 hypothetical protein [Oligoflexia bacterium]
MKKLRRIVVGTELKTGETRCALSPEGAEALSKMGYNVDVQEYPNRVFPDQDYSSAGLRIIEDSEPNDLIVGIKEFKPSGTPKGIKERQMLLGFHHAHKGQPYNLPMLKEAIEKGASLFDYELYRIGKNQPVTTSPHAGMVGAYNGIAACLSQRCIESPVPEYFLTYENMLSSLRNFRGFEDLRVIIVGSGACGQGARKFLMDLGFSEVHSSYEELSRLKGPWFRVLKTGDVFERQDGQFDYEDYLKFGKTRYESVFERYLGSHDLLIHCPYWDNRYPKLMSEELFERNMKKGFPVISDVTCDLYPNGSLACTTAENNMINWKTPYRQTLVTAVDCLPTQIAKTCSLDMSRELVRLVPELLLSDQEGTIEESGLSKDLMSGFLVWNGNLAERYRESLLPLLKKAG